MENTSIIASLLQSCTVLFGQDIDISREFLDYLQLSGVKSAYRRRARETHPDLVRFSAAKDTLAPLESFYNVQESYEKLAAYLKDRESRRQPPVEASRPVDNRSFRGAEGGCWETGDVADIFQEECAELWFPRRKLLFGDFLYFAGIAQWQDVIRALVWQKASRPRLGDLGCSLGWLQHNDIPRIFQAYRSGNRFGEVAVRLGYLDAGQRDRLIFFQKCRQQKIGQYFVEKGFLTNEELLLYIKLLRRHNAFYSA